MPYAAMTSMVFLSTSLPIRERTASAAFLPSFKSPPGPTAKLVMSNPWRVNSWTGLPFCASAGRDDMVAVSNRAERMNRFMTGESYGSSRTASSATHRDCRVVYPDRHRTAWRLMSDDDLRAELERLRNENAALKKGAAKGISMKVSEKGGLSIY